MDSIPAPLLELDEVSVEYRGPRGKPPVRAVDHVSLSIGVGETLGLVGESGSGKSTLGNAVLGLVPVKEGRIRFDGAEITRIGRGQRRRLSKDLQVIFQDPYSSLNPSMTVGDVLAEPLLVQSRLTRRQVRESVGAMLATVGLPQRAAQQYPSEFSGGQRQRVAIARALMVHPKLVICDEPTSSLDLSIQAQILNLLADLQRDLHVSFLFISHDLMVVRHVAHRAAVIYRGSVVETGDVADVYAAPQHPYTRRLLGAAPVPDPEIQRRRRDARQLEDDTVSAPAPRDSDRIALSTRPSEEGDR